MKHLSAFLFALFCACSPAFADAPHNLQDAEEYARAGGSHWGRSWAPPTSSGTSGLVLHTPGDTSYTLGDQHLFTWGTAIRVCCKTNPAVFSFQLDTGTTIATSGLITDSTISGTSEGPVFFVDNYCVNEVLQRSMFINSSGGLKEGYRAGFCTSSTPGYAYTRWPCDADADCPSSGTCRTACVVSGVNYCDAGTNPFTMMKGAFLQSLSDTTAAACSITEVR